jgi:membrane associated rhomboid family serine protease
VLLLVGVCVLPELVLLWAAVAEPQTVFVLRRAFFALGAFQPDLLSGRGPIFAGQSISMFVTYGILHTGLPHLILNMTGLVWLGRLTLARRSSETFLTFYLLSTIGAAEVFVLFSPPDATMVGASGALFGLLGIYLVDNTLLPESAGVQRLGAQVIRILLITLGLILADVLSSMVLGSSVAWQAHAGGFVVGAIVALIAPPRQPKGS